MYAHLTSRRIALDVRAKRQDKDSPGPRRAGLPIDIPLRQAIFLQASLAL
ncbi:hypothetical protein [Octadecabacter antarcticus]|nr:hypothetical protein [Octadecabacter antarcticus]